MGLLLVLGFWLGCFRGSLFAFSHIWVKMDRDGWSWFDVYRFIDE
jgi:hypothetical protein